MGRESDEQQKCHYGQVTEQKVEEKEQWAICSNLGTFKPPCSAASKHLVTLFSVALLGNVTAVQ